MREIKFRIWLPKDKILTYDDGTFYLTADGDVLDINNDLPFDDEPILMQYTGLKDDNGREIYEGDILKILNPEWPEDETEFVEVKWCADSDYPAFDIPDSVESDECNGLFQGLNNGGIFEVVGNIYENPGLLKEGAEE